MTTPDRTPAIGGQTPTSEDREALREMVARIVDPWAFSVVGNIMHTERASEDRKAAYAKADAILAALPTPEGV